MKVEGSYTIKADRQKVWDALLSPEVLSSCIPGCESFEPAGDETYDVVMKVGVAAVSGTYTGKITIADKHEPDSYTMHVQGKGAAGTIGGEGVLTFTDIDGETLVDLTGEARITGIIARVGQRFMGSASKMLMKQFFDCLRSKVE